MIESSRGSTGLGIVASGHPSVCDAAAEILRAGGNAFDAAVAAGFTSPTAEPALTSLGGGGFLLTREASGRAVLFDFFVDTPGRERPAGDLEPHFLPVTVRFPGSDQVFNTGRGAVAVPGILKGLLHVHERLGRLPLAEVLAPAIRLAREGVIISRPQGYFLELLRPIMCLTPEGSEIFAPRGELLREGDRLRNPDLASFLESLPGGGARDFYEGTLAERIARDMREGQGLLTAQDLSEFRVVEREPLQTSYRDHRLLTNPRPSFGGSLLALSLRLLEASQDGDGSEHAADSALRLLSLVGVMQEVEALRERGCLEPDSLSRDEQEQIGQRLRHFSRGTTHVSVCDAEGNAASMSTSNGEGSGYIVPRTGIMLNNMMGEDDLHPEGFHSSPPGLRVASMMSPSLLLRGDELRLVLGSGGSKRIRTALLQVISLFVDCDLPIEEAVERPRLHWDGEAVQAEPGFPVASLDALRRHQTVNEWSRPDVYFGGVHAAVPRGEGAGDSRRGGSARAVEELAASGG
jgi:gamma-glutamyltranspeptidase/glutathione hydrolase